MPDEPAPTTTGGPCRPLRPEVVPQATIDPSLPTLRRSLPDVDGLTLEQAIGEATGVIAREGIDRGVSKKRFRRPMPRTKSNALRVMIESWLAMIRARANLFLGPYGEPS